MVVSASAPGLYPGCVACTEPENSKQGLVSCDLTFRKEAEEGLALDRWTMHM